MPGLLDLYNSNASNFDNPNPLTNVGATAQSQLHGFGTQPGYSLGNPAVANNVIIALNAYDDGVNNLPPTPSILDLSFNAPINTPQYNFAHTYLPEYTYLDNPPE